MHATSQQAVQRRRSDRVFIRIPISIVGTDQNGRDFTERAVTHMLSRFGASIITKLPLVCDQEMTLIPADRKAIQARVIGQTSIVPEGHIYGIEFLNSTVEFWGIHFPPSTEAAGAAIDLECCQCQARETVRLNDLQFEVFQANDRLRRACRQCADVTTWHLAGQGAERKPPQASQGRVTRTEPAEPQSSAATPPEFAAMHGPKPQRRAHPRVRVSLKACIAQPGSEGDVANVVDMSRGGVLVSSQRVYAPETWVELAVPYTPAAANIFVPARIVRRTDGGGTYQYGIKYAGR